MLTKEEIQLILDLLEKQYGPGYSKHNGVARLQAKLLEAKERTETLRDEKYGEQLHTS